MSPLFPRGWENSTMSSTNLRSSHSALSDHDSTVGDPSDKSRCFQSQIVLSNEPKPVITTISSRGNLIINNFINLFCRMGELYLESGRNKGLSEIGSWEGSFNKRLSGENFGPL